MLFEGNSYFRYFSTKKEIIQGMTFEGGRRLMQCKLNANKSS